MRGHWQKGKRRNDVDAQVFIANLCDQLSCRKVADICGVDEKTVRRWKTGQCWPTEEKIFLLVDRLFPNSGSLPIYRPSMVDSMDGFTRTFVGEYTRQAARGNMEYFYE